MAWSTYETLYKVLMNINESGCQPWGWPRPWWWSVYPRDTSTVSFSALTVIQCMSSNGDCHLLRPIGRVSGTFATESNQATISVTSILTFDVGIICATISTMPTIQLNARAKCKYFILKWTLCQNGYRSSTYLQPKTYFHVKTKCWRNILGGIHWTENGGQSQQ